MTRRRIRFVVGLAALLFPVSGAAAQTTAVSRPAEPRVVATLSDVSRFESWSFFEPPGTADPTYTLLGNRATLAVAIRSRRIDLRGAFQYALLVGVPRRANFLGSLGPGGVYFDASRATAAYQLYIRAMSIRVKGAGGLSIEAGRMDFTSAAEGASPSAAVEQLTHDRLAGRLIGGAGWTPFERAFDGARVDLTRSRLRATASLLFPTQGAFEESANPTMSAVRVATGTLAVVWPAKSAPASESARTSELQVFAAHYRDRRAVRARPDNSGLRAARIDVDISTLGASHVSLVPWRAGQFDTVIWAARQFGDWYGADHDAFSVMAEGGYQFHRFWEPHIRAGVMHASGDDGPRDARHGTFFPMLPTTAPALLAGTFAQMNLRQAFAEVRLTPSPRLTLSTSLSRLSLAESEDRWYSGTGATAINGTYFGFAGRFTGATTGLGTLMQAGADMRVSAPLRLKAELGIMRGGDVVRRQFSDRPLVVFALESRLAF